MALSVYDINEHIRTTAGTESSTLAETITLLQTGRTFTCPKCDGTGGFTEDGVDAPIICDVCEGYGKTVVQYEEYEAQVGYRIVES